MTHQKNKQSKANIVVSLSMLSMLGVSAIKTAKAQIVSFSCPQPLLYGQITSCGTGPNTVLITTGGTRTVGGCLTGGAAPFTNAACNLVQGGLPRPARFSVAAGANTLNSGVNTMTYNNINLVTNAGGLTQTMTGFFITVPIGATLNVPASQPAGTYTGTFTLNANLL